MTKYVKVARADDIPPGTKKIVEVDGIEVVVVNLDGQFYAVEDVCTHDGGPLGEGKLDGCELHLPAARRALRRPHRRRHPDAGDRAGADVQSVRGRWTCVGRNILTKETSKSSSFVVRPVMEAK